jgi:hypothetical protein
MHQNLSSPNSCLDAHHPALASNGSQRCMDDKIRSWADRDPSGSLKVLGFFAVFVAGGICLLHLFLGYNSAEGLQVKPPFATEPRMGSICVSSPAMPEIFHASSVPLSLAARRMPRGSSTPPRRPRPVLFIITTGRLPSGSGHAGLVGLGVVRFFTSRCVTEKQSNLC